MDFPIHASGPLQWIEKSIQLGENVQLNLKRLEESNEQGMFTLENPNRYPEGKGPIPIKILEGRSPEGFDWNSPLPKG